MQAHQTASRFGRACARTRIASTARPAPSSRAIASETSAQASTQAVPSGDSAARWMTVARSTPAIFANASLMSVDHRNGALDLHHGVAVDLSHQAFDLGLNLALDLDHHAFDR